MKLWDKIVDLVDKIPDTITLIVITFCVAGIATLVIGSVAVLALWSLGV